MAANAQLGPADIRQRVQAELVAALEPQGWHVSRYAYDAFPGLDSRAIEHQSFAVGVPSSTIDDSQRQRLEIGVVAHTTVGVRFAHRVRGDAHVADYDEALEAELLVVRAAIGVHRDPALSVRLVGIPTRQVLADHSLYHGEIVLSVQHMYPIH